VPVLAAPGGEVDAERLMVSCHGQPLARRERFKRTGNEQVAALVEAQVREVGGRHG
jgi:hypothetical protein